MVNRQESSQLKLELTLLGFALLHRLLNTHTQYRRSHRTRTQPTLTTESRTQHFGPISFLFLQFCSPHL